MNGALPVASSFVREHLRDPLTLGLLLTIPVLFVVLTADVLEDFARALGGSLAGDGAGALGAGWAAAFLAGALGYFQVASSREADRRLALAGLGPWRVAGGRIGASLALGAVVSVAAFATLAVAQGIEHPAHAAIAIFAFAAIYIGIGAIVGALVRDQLAGSLAVVFVFMVDVFSGPGMSGAGGLAEVTPTRDAAELLISAGVGEASPGADWVSVAVIAGAALSIAFATFWFAARARS